MSNNINYMCYLIKLYSLIVVKKLVKNKAFLVTMIIINCTIKK